MKWIILMTIMFAFYLPGIAAISVSGVIKDTDGNGIPGVKVSIEGITGIAVTTTNGSFIINVNNSLYIPGTPVVFSISKNNYEPESPNLLRQYIPNPNVTN